MLEATLPLIAVSVLGLVIGTLFALLKKLTSRSTKIVVGINSLFPILLFLIGLLGRQLSDCPHLVGDCYNEEYSGWRYLVLLPGSAFWLLFNIVLLALISYFLAKKFFTLVFFSKRIRK